MHWNQWCNSWHLCQHYTRRWFPRGIRIITCVSFNHVQVLLSMSRHCSYQKWHSHLGQHYHCWPNTNIFISPILHNSKICCIEHSSNQGKELSQLMPHWSIPHISNWDIWLLTQTCWCVFTRLCQCYLELEGDRRPSSFYLGHFFSSKSFDHIIKDVNVFHLVLGDSCNLHYFPTSTPSKHTSHHHGWPIVSHWFLTCKYGQPSTSSWLWTYIDFHSNFKPTWHLVTSPFSFILLLCNISLIYDVFFNKIYKSLIIRL
jgi:hypothetical protein